MNIQAEKKKKTHIKKQQQPKKKQAGLKWFYSKEKKKLNVQVASKHVKYCSRSLTGHEGNRI